MAVKQKANTVINDSLKERDNRQLNDKYKVFQEYCPKIENYFLVNSVNNRKVRID